MNLLRQIDQLSRLHRLMHRQATGSPGILSRRLGISRSKLYMIIDMLRLCGADISYSRQQKTFYYRNDFEIELHYRIGPLSEEELAANQGSGHCSLQIGYWYSNTERPVYGTF